MLIIRQIVEVLFLSTMQYNAMQYGLYSAVHSASVSVTQVLWSRSQYNITSLKVKLKKIKSVVFYQALRKKVHFRFSLVS